MSYSYSDLLQRQYAANKELISGLLDGWDTLNHDLDIDTAAGAKLDKIAAWFNLTRYWQVPTQDGLFGWHTGGAGFNVGKFASKFSLTTYAKTLADEELRALIKAKITLEGGNFTLQAFNDALMGFDNNFTAHGANRCITIEVKDGYDAAKLLILQKILSQPIGWRPFKFVKYFDNVLRLDVNGFGATLGGDVI